MSISKQILDARNFFQKYKLDLCIQTLNSIKMEKIEDIDENIQLIFYTLKGNALSIKENYKEALIFAKKSYQLSKNIENCLEKVESYLLLALIFMNLNQFDQSSKFIQETNLLIQNLPKDFIKAKKKFKASLLRIKAGKNRRLNC